MTQGNGQFFSPTRQRAFVPHRVDKNQPLIVKAFRQLGCKVHHLHGVAQGCPDVMVGIDGFNVLVEIKNGDKPPSQRRLTPLQQEWHFTWTGQKCIIKNIDEAIALVALVRRTAQQIRAANISVDFCTTDGL